MKLFHFSPVRGMEELSPSLANPRMPASEKGWIYLSPSIRLWTWAAGSPNLPDYEDMSGDYEIRIDFSINVRPAGPAIHRMAERLYYF